MHGYKCSFEITIRLKQKYLSNTLYIYKLCSPLKNTVPIEEWLAASTFVTKKLCTLKKLFLEIKYSPLKRKNVFLGTTTLLWVTVFSYELLFH